MLDLDKIKNNTLLLTDSTLKKSILLEISKNKIFTNIKIMTFDEFIKEYNFNYTNKTIYYVMHKYNVKVSIALIYIRNLYFVGTSDYNIDKLKFLIDLKQELLENNLVQENYLFREKVKSMHITVYGDVPAIYKNAIDKLNEFTDVTYIDIDNSNNYTHDIYECNNMDSEIEFVVKRIASLLDSGIQIDKIKLANVSREYQTIIRRIFSIFNIPITLNENNNLYSVSMGNFFLDNIESDIEITLNKIKDKYNLKNENLNNQYNKLLNICNSYNWCNDYLSIKDLLIYELQQCNITNNIGGIDVIDLEKSVPENDEYVFLIGCNQGIFPCTEKDEDYLNDTIKEKLNLETTVIKNNKHLETTLRFIKNTKNLVITYPKYVNGPMELSNINDILKYQVTKVEGNNYGYSNLNNTLLLGQMLDTYIKYGVKDTDLSRLLNTYPKNNYLKYDNKFTKINVESLKKYKNNYLTLSYSSIDAYFHCAFKFYISNILKLNIYEENFMNYIGSLFHFVLSKYYEKDFDFDISWNEFISNNVKELSNKEKYFLNKLKDELHFIIDTLDEQKKYTSFNEFLLEEKIDIDKSINGWKINFVGIVDKILLLKKDNQRLVAVVDYKTGNPSLDLTKVPNGLGMQLPIYLYLINSRYSNAEIVGFYLQKILPTSINRDSKKTYIDQKKDYLKLQGYSVTKESLLKEFDNTYEDSKLIKSMRTTSKGFASYSKVLTTTEMDNLQKLVNKNIDNAINNIIDGNFEVNPKQINGDLVGCEFCKFKDICFRNNKDIVNLEEYKDLSFLGGEDNA